MLVSAHPILSVAPGLLRRGMRSQGRGIEDGPPAFTDLGTPALPCCGCVNGVCTWKPNSTFESCLKGHGIDPSKVIHSGHFELEIRGINKSDEDINASVKDFLGAFGVSCSAPLILVKTSVTRLSPQVDPSEPNASGAVKAELEWLRSVGALRVNDKGDGGDSKCYRMGFLLIPTVR